MKFKSRTPWFLDSRYLTPRARMVVFAFRRPRLLPLAAEIIPRLTDITRRSRRPWQPIGGSGRVHDGGGQAAVVAAAFANEKTAMSDPQQSASLPNARSGAGDQEEPIASTAAARPRPPGRKKRNIAERDPRYWWYPYPDFEAATKPRTEGKRRGQRRQSSPKVDPTPTPQAQQPATMPPSTSGGGKLRPFRPEILAAPNTADPFEDLLDVPDEQDDLA